MKRSWFHGLRKAVLVGALVVGAAVAAGAQPVLWQSGFETGLEGWSPRGGAEVLKVVAGGHTGGSSLSVSGRTTTWQGPIRPLASPLVPGASYRIGAWLKYDQGPATRAFNLSVELVFKDPAAAHQYKNLASVTFTKGTWGAFSADFVVPTDPSLDRVLVYFESPWKADDQVTADDRLDFLVDDVVVGVNAADQRPVAQDDIPGLRQVLAGDFLLGTALEPGLVDPSDPHQRLIAKHYGVIVAGNAMKPDALQPQEGKFSFAQADKLVKFANQTGIVLRGHTLLWHNQTPAWFFTDPKDPTKPASRELLLSRLKTHITTVVDHFRGEVAVWDVVNEVLSDSQGLRTGAEGSRWHAILGPDYIDQAFRFARAADPDAVLVINDYNLESSPAKRAAMVELVKGMKARGVPVDAVGLQGHISLYGPSVDEFRKAIQTFAALGVKVQVTELDVSIYSGASEPQKTPDAELLNAQGRRYAQLFQMFREEARAGHLDMVLLWGSADDDTWLDNFPVAGRLDAPLLFDRRLQAKPAYWGIIDPSRLPAEKPRVVNRTEAVRGTPTIDGQAEPTWDRTPAALITLGSSASGEVKLLWDDSTLYALVTVSDPTLDDSATNPWEQDSVEVFLDQNNHKTGSYEDDDGQFRVNYRNVTSFNGHTPTFRSAARVVPGGYVVELAIAFDAVKPQAGTVVGFDAQVNDATKGARTGQRNFNDTTNTGWQSTSAFGEAVLK